MNLITQIESYSFYNREDKALVMKHENEAVVINSVSDIPKDVRENLNAILEGNGVTTGKDYTSNSTFELLLEIKRAAEEGDFIRLKEKEYILESQIKITKANNGKIKGIKGVGQGKSVLRFNWAQEYDWDSNTNKTDSRLSCGILVHKVADKVFEDFTIKYEGEFYRPDDVYFGQISCLVLMDTKRCRVERVEASGGNRAGIFIGAISPETLQENIDFYNGRVKLDDLKYRGEDNVVIDCHTHHNRSAGVLVQNQKGNIVRGCLCEFNGHEASGGTGYGITAFSGSVNASVTWTGNTTRSNYRKGLDTHDACDAEISDNTSDGDRFFGIAIEGRGYPQRNIRVLRNKLINNPNFILERDVTHKPWTTFASADNPYRNFDYYQWTGVRVENKPQPNQTWKNQPNVDVLIEGNTVEGVDWTGRKGHRVFEWRNNEGAKHVKTNVVIKNNTVTGKRIHHIFFASANDTAHIGLGKIEFANNTITYEEGMDTPIFLQEKNGSAVIPNDMPIHIHHNVIKAGKNVSWSQFLYIQCPRHPLIIVEDNELHYKTDGVRRVVAFELNEAGSVHINLMNNKFVCDRPKEEFMKQFLLNSKMPLNRAFVSGNTYNGEAITVEGTATEKFTFESTVVKVVTFEDGYVKPKLKGDIPTPIDELDWENATNEEIPIKGKTTKVTKAGSYPPRGYEGLVDKTNKYIRARLRDEEASAGVYGLMPVTKSAKASLMMEITIKSLGGRPTGTSFVGFAVKQGETISESGGGFGIKRGGRDDLFVINRQNGIYVNGVPYTGQELKMDTKYVVTMTHLSNIELVTLGSIWNGNGQVSADIFNAIYYDKELTEAEVGNAYLALKGEATAPATGGEQPAAPTPAPAQPQPQPPAATEQPANPAPTQPPANNEPAAPANPAPATPTPQPAPATPKKLVTFNLRDNVAIGAKSVTNADGVKVTVEPSMNTNTVGLQFNGMVQEDGDHRVLVNNLKDRETKYLGTYIDFEGLPFVAGDEVTLVAPVKFTGMGIRKASSAVAAFVNSEGPDLLYDERQSTYTIKGNAGKINGTVTFPALAVERDKWYLMEFKVTWLENMKLRIGGPHNGNGCVEMKVGEGFFITAGEVTGKTELAAKYGITLS
jgi:hypothetical protein|nr:MAG TPA: Right handed beta helix region [Caudoviricetes sp.]